MNRSGRLDRDPRRSYHAPRPDHWAPSSYLVRRGQDDLDNRNRNTVDEQLRRQRSVLFEDAVAHALNENNPPQNKPARVIWESRRRRRAKGPVRRFATTLVAVATIAVCAIMIAAVLNAPTPAQGAAAIGTSIWRHLKTAVLSLPRKPPMAATLSVSDQVGQVNATLPLGMAVAEQPPGTVIVLTGLPAGSRMTAARKVSADDWRIAAQDIAAATVTPPDDFAGRVTVNAVMRNSAGAALAHGTFRMTWLRQDNVANVAGAIAPRFVLPTAAPAIAPPQVAAPPTRPAATATPRTRSSDRAQSRQ